ncbi:MAG TPA: SulP family inorganic anion transporter [Gammaproteobacteria bacterium]|jgi:SulP family sulfate permease|nr:SulP family inorganic anion transporter [Gammaproteobacteria bacterium]
MIAILEAHHNGLLKRQYWGSNLFAGLIVGIVALPLAMAFAIASGAKPEQGLYTAIIAAVVVGLFGGSRVQIAGPTGAFVVILAGITTQYGMSGLQTATIIAGLMLILMGMLRLGNVIKFIPDTVITGFTAGIGFVIFSGELKDFFGLPVHIALNASFYEKFSGAIQALPSLDIATTLIAILSLLLVIFTRKFNQRIPGPLTAMLAAIILQMIFHFDSVATIGSMFGGIPQKLPALQLPDLSPSRIILLLQPAFAIALLGAIESLLSAAAADTMTGNRHHSNQELIGQGLANIFTPIFGGFAATGAIARTATNIKNGGNSPIAALCHSAFLIAVIVLLAPFAAYIPMCSLAAILFVVAYHMSGVPHFINILRNESRFNSFVLLTTFSLTIFADLITAVITGVIIASMAPLTRRSLTLLGFADDSLPPKI